MDVIRTNIFNQWLHTLRDRTWKNRIASRIFTIEQDGHFGDTKYLRDGVWELRFKSGSGFRVYYARRGQQVVILLCAGDKSSQQPDIEKAIAINAHLNELPL